MDQKRLERYIDRVIKLQEERSQRLSEAELESIALDLGLSPEEVAREVDAHLQRGRGYMTQRMWDDAIKELREAEALAPGNVEILVTLARAHAERWRATDFPDDKEIARKLAREALDIEPGHGPAFELLGLLEHGSAARQSIPPSSRSPSAMGRTLLTVIGIGVLVLIATGGAVGYLVLGTRDASQPVTVKEVIVPNSPATEPAELPADDDSEDGTPGSTDLEVELAGDAAKDVEFDVRRSRLDVYEDSSFYGLKAVMKNVSDRELTTVDAALELYGDDGEVLFRDDPSLLWDHQPKLRPGDVTPINLTQRASAKVRGVRLIVKRTEGSPAASVYPAAKPVDVIKGATFADHLKLEVRERSATFAPNGSPEAYFRATFELENLGETAIDELKLQLDLYAGDELLETKTGIVTYSMTPAIHPGETWLESFIAKVPERYDRYELTITRME